MGCNTTKFPQKKLIESMPNQVSECIKANGGLAK